MSSDVAHDAFIHPSSVVDDGAVIGSGSKVWHFCHVSAGARIGRNSILGQGCFVSKTAEIGDGVKIQNGVSVYDGVVIEDGVFCGPHMIFTNVINPRAFLERKHEFRETRVGRGATIGAGAVVVCGHSIGAYAMVGAGAVVTRDVAPHALVYGNPARQHGWVDRYGNKLNLEAAGVVPGEDGSWYRVRDGRLVVEAAA